MAHKNDNSKTRYVVVGLPKDMDALIEGLRRVGPRAVRRPHDRTAVIRDLLEFGLQVKKKAHALPLTEAAERLYGSVSS